MENELEDFLIHLDLPKCKIDELKAQKIDCYAVTVLPDDQLEKYISKTGDRCRTRRFCSQYLNAEKKSTCRSSFIERLKERMALRRREETCESQNEEKYNRSGKLRGNYNARKEVRKIEIGWLDYCSTSRRYIQVRSRQGGGTRDVRAGKDWKASDILDCGKRLFFQNNESRKGKEEEFYFSIRDFCQNEIEQDMTLEELYNNTKMRTLRFYIFTKKKSLCEEDLSNTLPDIEVPHEKQGVRQCDNMSLDEGHTAFLSSSAPDFPSSDPATTSLDSSESCLSQPAPIIIQSTNTNFDSLLSSQESSRLETCITDQALSSSSGSESQSIMHCTFTSQNSHTLPNRDSQSSCSALESVSFTSQDSRTIPVTFSIGQVQDDSQPSCSTVDHLVSGAQDGFSSFTHIIPIPVGEDVVFSYGTDSLDLLQSVSGSDEPSVNDFNVSHRESMASNMESAQIRLHQGNVFSELLSLFKCTDMKLAENHMKRILPNGKEESAEGTGVLRDILTEFWETFYLKCCDGANVKVPILRHDMGECEWASVARIMVEGYKVLQFFPIQISPLFLEECVYGSCPESLITEFLEYIPESERRILKQAIDDFKSVESEDSISDLVDVLETHECRTFPTQGNIMGLIHEIAHKEMIQEPKFVSDCWCKVICPTFLSISKEEFRNIVQVRRPSVKKVIASLRILDNISAQQSVVASHLKRFIKGLDNRNLEKFLRFCTGACFLTGSINVEFTSSCTGLARRPTSKTCVNSLILPSQYENFADFKEEFLNVLESNVWDMDFI